MGIRFVCFFVAKKLKIVVGNIEIEKVRHSDSRSLRGWQIFGLVIKVFLEEWKNFARVISLVGEEEV